MQNEKINISETMREDICQSIKQVFGDKLLSIILFGSYARGDFDPESDVDVAVLVACDRKELSEYHASVVRIMNHMMMTYGVLVSIIEIPGADFEKYKDALPFYQNVAKEGVKISA